MKEKDYKQIADNIRKYRLLHKMTQEQMAYELDIDTQYYSQLEQGRRHFTLERIMDSCDIFHIRIEDIVKSPKPSEEDTSKLVAQINEKLLAASYRQLLLIDRLVEDLTAYME